MKIDELDADEIEAKLAERRRWKQQIAQLTQTESAQAVLRDVNQEIALLENALERKTLDLNPSEVRHA